MRAAAGAHCSRRGQGWRSGRVGWRWRWWWDDDDGSGTRAAGKKPRSLIIVYYKRSFYPDRPGTNTERKTQKASGVFLQGAWVRSMLAIELLNKLAQLRCGKKRHFLNAVSSCARDRLGTHIKDLPRQARDTYQGNVPGIKRTTACFAGTPSSQAPSWTALRRCGHCTRHQPCPELLRWYC